MENLNYHNSKEGFFITFPKSWLLYRSFESSSLIDENLHVKTISFALPTRSQDWKPMEEYSGLAVMFSIFVFPEKKWEYYREKYTGRANEFKLIGRVLGKRNGKVFFVSFSTSIPADLFFYMKESEGVVSTFRFSEK